MKAQIKMKIAKEIARIKVTEKLEGKWMMENKPLVNELKYIIYKTHCE